MSREGQAISVRGLELPAQNWYALAQKDALLLTVRVLELAALLPVNRGRSLCVEFAAASMFRIVRRGGSIKFKQRLDICLVSSCNWVAFVYKTQKEAFP